MEFLQELPPLALREVFFEFWYINSKIFSKTWFVLPPIFLFIAYYIWLFFKREHYLHSVKWVYLAVSIPAESEVDPKSMEQVIAGFYGIKTDPNFVERYWEGQSQLHMSLELIGIDGHIRFIISSPAEYRDLIEANIYAYYPDAEIVEIEDYSKYMPKMFPNDKYQMFGTEFVLNKPDAYPIRTYKKFANEIDKGFIDPVATITEVMSRLQEGEQIWLQWLIKPVSDSWKDKGEKLIAKLIHLKAEKKEDFIQKNVLSFLHGVEKGVESAVGVPEAAKKEEYEPITWMQHLPPSEKEVVEAIGENIAKIAFETKLRFIYIARKEIFNKTRRNAVIGAISLFNTQNLNGFKSHKKMKTKVDYFTFRIPYRQRRIMRYYKERTIEKGVSPFVFNIEELATVFHFPYTTVKAPTLVRTEAKKAEPPVDLPVS
jgi:hypothetical protein